MNSYKKDFPLFSNQNIIYLDSAATSQKPQSVIDAEAKFYADINANPHRGAYDISIAATQLLDNVRQQTREWMHANSEYEIVFTKNATEGLNLIAMSYGMNAIHEGDEIVIAISEHHSNLVPWQIVAKAKKAVLNYMYTDENGIISEKEINQKITEKTKIVAIAHASNVTGVVNPIEQIIQLTHKKGGIVVVDGTQASPHLRINLDQLNPDFYVISGHKVLAPMGIGVVCGKKELLEKMDPFLYGGDMIEYVEEQSATYAPIPQKFEAGTQNLGSVAGFGAALSYIENIGMDVIQKQEQELLYYLMENILKIPYIQIVGPQSMENRIGVVSFTLEDVHPHDIATILNQDHIAIRAGNHCAQPLHNFLKKPATARASIGIYNTKEDIDGLVDSLTKVRRWLGYGT